LHGPVYGRVLAAFSKRAPLPREVKLLCTPNTQNTKKLTVSTAVHWSDHWLRNCFALWRSNRPARSLSGLTGESLCSRKYGRLWALWAYI